MGSAEQHRLLLQNNARLAMLQHAIDHIARLISFITHQHQLRLLGRRTVRT
jgi:hypothetical protein